MTTSGSDRGVNGASASSGITLHYAAAPQGSLGTSRLVATLPLPELARPFLCHSRQPAIAWAVCSRAVTQRAVSKIGIVGRSKLNLGDGLGDRKTDGKNIC
jgi:hypothetical protein